MELSYCFGNDFVILVWEKEVKQMGKEYLMQGVLVLLILMLTFVFTILYAKKASKKNRQNK